MSVDFEVYCIDPGDYPLTHGKSYQVRVEYDEYYILVNDIGIKRPYYKSRFTLSQVAPKEVSCL